MILPYTTTIDGLKMVIAEPSGLGVIVPPRPQTAEQLFAEHPEVVVAVDGPMFSICEGQPDDYARYQCGRVNYRLDDPSHGVRVPSRNTDVGVTFSLVGGSLTALRGSARAPGASVSIQCYPGLVEEGSVAVSRRTSGPDSESNGRVAIGITASGKLFFAYARMSMFEFATALQRSGVTWAGYTDGGGSSSLVQRLPNGTLQGSDSDDPRGRRVPSWLVWSTSSPSGGGGRIGLPTASYVVPAAIVVGALAGTAYFLRRRSTSMALSRDSSTR